MKEQGIPVKLDVWQITSEFAIIEQYYDEVTVLFLFWDENKKEVLDKVGRLFFSGVWTMRYSRFKTRYYPNEIDHEFRSCYLIVKNSKWLNSLKRERSKRDKDWRKYDQRKYKHFVVNNNAYYVEIIAPKVKFDIIDKSEYLWRRWDE